MSTQMQTTNLIGRKVRVAEHCQTYEEIQEYLKHIQDVGATPTGNLEFLGEIGTINTIFWTPDEGCRAVVEFQDGRARTWNIQHLHLLPAPVNTTAGQRWTQVLGRRARLLLGYDSEEKVDAKLRFWAENPKLKPGIDVGGGSIHERQYLGRYGTITTVFHENLTLYYGITLDDGDTFTSHCSQVRIHDEPIPEEAPTDAVHCRRCGKEITDAEYDDNGGLCGDCSEEPTS